MSQVMPGAPDYARLSLAGGVELFSAAGSIPENTVVFEGYVGSWPYINLYASISGATEAIRVIMLYFSDSTFTQSCGFRYAVRDHLSFASTQYSNLAPWMQFFYSTLSGNPVNFDVLSLFATQGYAPQTELASLDVPIIGASNSIAASSSLNIEPQHIQPGAAVFNVQTNAASWFIQIQRWDYPTGTWVFYMHLDNTICGAGGFFEVPMLDCPCRININNQDAAAKSFYTNWVSK